MREGEREEGGKERGCEGGREGGKERGCEGGREGGRSGGGMFALVARL